MEGVVETMEDEVEGVEEIETRWKERGGGKMLGMRYYGERRD